MVEPPPSTLVEMFDVMAELQAMVARFAACHHAEKDQSAIQAAIKACKAGRQTGDVEAYYCANEVFHYALYEASHHAFFIEQCRQLHRRLKPFRRL